MSDMAACVRGLVRRLPRVRVAHFFGCASDCVVKQDRHCSATCARQCKVVQCIGCEVHSARDDTAGERERGDNASDGLLTGSHTLWCDEHVRVCDACTICTHCGELWLVPNGTRLTRETCALFRIMTASQSERTDSAAPTSARRNLMSDVVSGLGVYNQGPRQVRNGRYLFHGVWLICCREVSSRGCVSYDTQSYGASNARCLPSETIRCSLKK
jgi:hypothetical protein